jgi:hypothetical protein
LHCLLSFLEVMCVTQVRLARLGVQNVQRLEYEAVSNPRTSRLPHRAHQALY